MILYQKQAEALFYVGWYGVCDETGAPDASDSDAPCQTIDLNTGQYADGTLLEWSNGKGLFREQLSRVSQVRNDGKTLDFYDMDVIRGNREFYRSIFGLDSTNAAQAVDNDIRNDLNSASPTYSIAAFADMVCGKAYTIIVQPGTGGGAVGATVAQIDIPEFRYMYVGTPDTGLRLTSECCGYGG